MKNRVKYAPIIILVLLALLFGSALSSCEKPDIYALIENILNDTGSYSFEADLNIEIRDNSNSAIPKELSFKISGRAKGGDAEIEVALVRADGEELEFVTAVHKKQELLCFELNDLSRIVSDLLSCTGFVDMTVRKLFDEMTGDEGTVLYVDLEDFDLSWFERYSDDISEAFAVKSSVVYDRSKEEIDIPEFEWVDGLNFGRVKNEIEKELLKLPYYRYSELYVILESAEDGENYINVLATRESGEREILQKLKIDCDLSGVREKPESVYYENILPMRYLMELLGESVGWDENKQTAYILDGGNKIYFEGSLINSKTYIPLDQFTAKTDYIVNSVVAGEYIEFKISRTY